MLKIIGVIILFVSVSAYGQLTSKTYKLEGTWAYKKGSGYETWSAHGNKLVGFEYRINKTGDTLKVERMTIRQVGENMMYSIGEHESASDTTIHHKNMNFKGTATKMDFINITSNTPYSITYKFSFFSKNRLKVKIRYVQKGKPAKLSLIRMKEEK